MARLLFFAPLLFLLALCNTPMVTAQTPNNNTTITHDQAKRQFVVTSRFERPKIEKAPSGAFGLSIEGLPNTVEEGLPSVPVKTIKVSLPKGATLKSTRFEEGAPEIVTGKIERNSMLGPYSWREIRNSPLTAEQSPQEPAGQYPSARVHSSLQTLHNVPIVVIDAYPVVVSPGQENFSLVREIKIVVEYDETQTFVAERDLFSHEYLQVQGFVDNPEMVERPKMGDGLVEAAGTNATRYDYLIITSSTFTSYTGPNSLKDLQSHLEGKDLRSRIADVASIQSGTQGKDLPEKIRNFIRNEYKQNGIRYVLLAGDGDGEGEGAVIPARRLWAKVQGIAPGADGPKTMEKEIAADLYYSCLDGDFDGNGNGKWGESSDGANGRDVDLLAEVVVGRMPMKTTAELQNFVRKTILVSSRPSPKTVLLMGEELFAEKNLYGGDYMNQLVGTCTDHGYTTHGYGTDWTIDRFFQTKEKKWDGRFPLSIINNGDFAMVNHLGHSKWTYNMQMDLIEIDKFANKRPFFYYTQGCYAGCFLYNDCFIELLVRHKSGAVAAVANTCYGLAPEDPNPSSTTTPGASQMLHRRFIDAALNGKTESLGRAHQLSKEAFIGFASSQEMRWVFWAANYFGDPSLKLNH